jgi:glucose/arabinose dehydrogenase
MRIQKLLQLSRLGLALIFVFAIALQVGSGQQTVPMQNGIPVAPRGLANRPLPKMPMEFDTAEGMRIRVSAAARNLENPFGLAFLPDGSMLVTERAGRLRIIRKGVLDPQAIAGVPMSRNLGVSGEPGAVHGFMDVVIHPKFSENQFVYICYTKPIDATRNATTIARGKWDGKAVTGLKDIFQADEGTSTARIAFGNDGKLYMTTVGTQGNIAQDPNSQSGKVLRLNDDGSVPPDNPFVGKAGSKPQVYTIGHRSSLGWQCIRGPEKCGLMKMVRMAVTKSTFSSLARTTAGRSSVMAGRIRDRGNPSIRKRRLRTAFGVLGAIDRGLRDGVLYRRQTSQMERGRVCWCTSHRGNSRYRSPRTNHV